MVRRPHPRLAASNARTAERMRQAAQLLAEDNGPVKGETRAGLIRLLNAVADQGGGGAGGVYIWGATANIADCLMAEPLDKSTSSSADLHQGDWYH